MRTDRARRSRRGCRGLCSHKLEQLAGQKLCTENTWVRFSGLELPVTSLALWVLVVSIAGQADFIRKSQVGDALVLRFLHRSGETCTVSCWSSASQWLSATCYKCSPEHLVDVLCSMHGNISLLLAFAFFSYLVPHQSLEHLFLKGLICMGIQDGGLLHRMLASD